MANPEHLEILMQGESVWNSWRIKNQKIRPDLSGANLSKVEFSGAIFYRVDLSRANLYKKNLFNEDFRKAILHDANLQEADLRRARLNGADLSGSNLVSANLADAELTDVDFGNSTMGWTILGGNELNAVKGLETVNHVYPSYLSIDTIYLSKGDIPEVFLRGCGVPEEFITYARSIATAANPVQFYSCFISYSSTDQDFAERLHADLQNRGVRCWFAPHDMKIGARIRPMIDESIRIYDKLLLILSENSVTSQWVEQEVETALAREREAVARPVLFPIRLDDAVMERKSGWPALIKNSRHIGDFRRWKRHDDYQKAFDRLLRDLRAKEGEER